MKLTIFELPKVISGTWGKAAFYFATNQKRAYVPANLCVAKVRRSRQTEGILSDYFYLGKEYFHTLS